MSVSLQEGQLIQRAYQSGTGEWSAPPWARSGPGQRLLTA